MKSVALSLAVAFALVVAAQTHAAPKDPAIGGYCPVAYVKAHKAIKGVEPYSSERDALRFLFSSGEAKKMYDAEPDKYRVAYAGWCATGVAMGKKIPSNPELFTVHDGVIYLFSSAEAKAAFDKQPVMTVAKADAAWARLK